jgi:putative transposase
MFELFDPLAEFRITEGTNMPHWFQPGVTYFITFRAEDSIPADVALRWHLLREEWLQQHGISTSAANWKVQFHQLPNEQRMHFHKIFSQEYMENLDKGWGKCVLKQPELAKIVADALLYFDGTRYHMGDFVVMPNHVHLLVCLLGDTDVVKQCYSWKKFSATKINKVLGQSGRFWQEESFDHLVRSPEQFHAIRQYIANNPSHLSDGEYLLYQRKIPM